MAKNKNKDTGLVPTTYYSIFGNSELVILTENGLTMRAPITHNILPGIKTVLSLPDDVVVNKHEVLFNKVLFNNHPKLLCEEMRKFVVELGYKEFNVERLVEESLAFVGGYNFIDAVGQDFDDIECSDAKTTSVNPNTGVAEVKGLSAKIGTLRILVYNPIVEDIHFFYLTFEQWKHLCTNCFGEKNKGDQRLRLIYSTDGTYNQFEKYRVNNFYDLATKTTLQPGWNTPI